MKLTLLGTSHGVPSEIRYCSCYMLEVGENIYIFDGGTPVIDLLLRRNKDMKNVKAFFNSHFHGDHINGALSMISLFEWYYKETDMDVLLPDSKSVNTLKNYLQVVDNVNLPSERIRLSEYGQGVIFDDGTVKVSAIRTGHNCGPDKNSNAFLIEAEGKSILYTGDMSTTLEDFPTIAYEKFINLIISENAHFPNELLMQCMDKVNTDTFVISHVWPVEKIDEFEKEADRFSFKLCTARDNDEFVI